LCLGCEATGCVTATYATNHVEPHKGDMMPFWNGEQWQPACRWHDDLVKQLLELMLARGELAVADLRFSSTAAIRLTLSLVDPDGQGAKNLTAEGSGPVA
jgi:5-methylcytosine-specific restriction enzyme A